MSSSLRNVWAAVSGTVLQSLEPNPPPPPPKATANPSLEKISSESEEKESSMHLPPMQRWFSKGFLPRGTRRFASLREDVTDEEADAAMADLYASEILHKESTEEREENEEDSPDWLVTAEEDTKNISFRGKLVDIDTLTLSAFVKEVATPANEFTLQCTPVTTGLGVEWMVDEDDRVYIYAFRPPKDWETTGCDMGPLESSGVVYPGDELLAINGVRFTFDDLPRITDRLRSLDYQAKNGVTLFFRFGEDFTTSGDSFKPRRQKKYFRLRTEIEQAEAIASSNASSVAAIAAVVALPSNALAAMTSVVLRSRGDHEEETEEDRIGSSYIDNDTPFDEEDPWWTGGSRLTLSRPISGPYHRYPAATRTATNVPVSWTAANSLGCTTIQEQQMAIAEQVWQRRKNILRNSYTRVHEWHLGKTIGARRNAENSLPPPWTCFVPPHIPNILLSNTPDLKPITVEQIQEEIMAVTEFSSEIGAQLLTGEHPIEILESPIVVNSNLLSQCGVTSLPVLISLDDDEEAHPITRAFVLGDDLIHEFRHHMVPADDLSIRSLLALPSETLMYSLLESIESYRSSAMERHPEVYPTSDSHPSSPNESAQRSLRKSLEEISRSDNGGGGGGGGEEGWYGLHGIHINSNIPVNLPPVELTYQLFYSIFQLQFITTSGPHIRSLLEKWVSLFDPSGLIQVLGWYMTVEKSPVTSFRVSIRRLSASASEERVPIVCDCASYVRVISELVTLLLVLVVDPSALLLLPSQSPTITFRTRPSAWYLFSHTSSSSSHGEYRKSDSIAHGAESMIPFHWLPFGVSIHAVREVFLTSSPDDAKALQRSTITFIRRWHAILYSDLAFSLLSAAGLNKACSTLLGKMNNVLQIDGGNVSSPGYLVDHLLKELSTSSSLALSPTQWLRAYETAVKKIIPGLPSSAMLIVWAALLPTIASCNEHDALLADQSNSGGSGSWLAVELLVNHASRLWGPAVVKYLLFGVSMNIVTLSAHGKIQDIAFSPPRQSNPSLERTLSGESDSPTIHGTNIQEGITMIATYFDYLIRLLRRRPELANRTSPFLQIVESTPPNILDRTVANECIEVALLLYSHGGSSTSDQPTLSSRSRASLLVSIRTLLRTDKRYALCVASAADACLRFWCPIGIIASLERFIAGFRPAAPVDWSARKRLELTFTKAATRLFSLLLSEVSTTSTHISQTTTGRRGGRGGGRGILQPTSSLVTAAANEQDDWKALVSRFMVGVARLQATVYAATTPPRTSKSEPGEEINVSQTEVLADGRMVWFHASLVNRLLVSPWNQAFHMASSAGETNTELRTQIAEWVASLLCGQYGASAARSLLGQMPALSRNLSLNFFRQQITPKMTAAFFSASTTTLPDRMVINAS